MPEKAIATWYRLSLRQLQIGEFLQQLRQVRMMNLIKLNSKQTLTWCRWYQASKCHVSLLAYLGRPAQSCKEWIHSYAEISCQTASSEEIMNELRTLDSLPLYIGLKLMTAWCTCHRCVFGADWLAPWAHWINDPRLESWQVHFLESELFSIAPLCLPDSNGSKRKVSLECVWMTGLSMPLIWKNLETIDPWNQCSRRGSLKKAPKKLQICAKTKQNKLIL